MFKHTLTHAFCVWVHHGFLLACLVVGASGLVTAQEAAPSERTSSEVLADILEDEAARQQLIDELRGASASVEQQETASPIGEPMAFSRLLARFTQEFAQNIVAEFSAAYSAFAEVGNVEDVDYAAFIAEVAALLIVIVATLMVFFLLRRLARPLFDRIASWAALPAESSALLRQTVAVVAAAIVDALVVVLAWVAGYLVALFVVGETGEMANRETLFLNAFLMIEIFKTVIRILFAARNNALRLLPMNSEDAAYWNAWLARLASFIGYGVLLVVPIISINISPAVGRVTTLVIMIVAFLYALAIVMQNKTLVAGKLRQAAESTDSNYTRYSFAVLARTWHFIAIAYFAALTVITLIRPEDALPVLLEATLQMALAVGLGVFVSIVLTQIIGTQLHLSDDARRKYPLLETRLNGFIPTVLKVMRVLILVVVLAVVLDAWGLFNLGAWLASETGASVILTVITVGIILAAAKGLWIVLASWIEERLNPESGRGEPSPREKTLLTIFRNALMVTLIILTLMIVLAEVGINIGPLIAGAGVLGLAIGFGSQKLVQDIITGVFIQMENAINAGDVVTAGGVTGVAEKLTIRSLGIRDLAGTYHIVPFSSVDAVANYMRDFAFHVGDYGVAYRENTDEVILRLREAFEELKSDVEQGPELLSDELEVHGVTALADSSVNVRVRIKTKPGSQWGVGRAYNRLVKRHLDAAGIEIPFPHTTIYFGQDKDGSAPPAPVRLEQKVPEGSESDVQPGKAKLNPEHKGDFDEPEN